MSRALLVVAAAILSTCAWTNASDNTGTNVADRLKICYNTTEYYDPDQRLPATINMLIDLIRIVEEKVPTLDARLIAIELAHRFRQDGIQKSMHSASNSNILPYAPKGTEYFKHKIMLDLLLPSTSPRLPQDALTVIEQCGLHFLTSNSLGFLPRGDEDKVCKFSAQYVRRPREAEDISESTDLNRGKPDPDSIFTRVTSTMEFSDCPVENGVIYTPWGEVHGGTLIAGIAAGFETQEFNNGDVKFDSKFAVTLSGDLVEVALFDCNDNQCTMGARGGFNSTLAPHWYFKEGAKHIYFTNPEIRADLDALILAKNVRAWNDKYRGIKVSQMLDAYYSNRGVFSSDIKACNRNKLSSEYAPQTELMEQTQAFGQLYNKESVLETSPTKEDVEKLTRRAVNGYYSSVSSLANVQCDSQDLDRTATDLIMVIDKGWDFGYIHRVAYYILDNLDINPYESNYTVVNAGDGSILVNSTYNLAKFPQYFNRTVYGEKVAAFDPYKAMNAIEDLHEERAKIHQESKSKLNGRSSTVVFMLKQGDSNHGDTILSRWSSVMDQYYPGTQHVVLAAGSRDSYNTYVRNPSTDIFTIPDSSEPDEASVKMTLNQLIKRLQEVPRKIINPNCGYLMSGGSASASMEVYVEPGTSNRYKVARQFLVSAATLKVRTQSNGKLSVCTSTDDATTEGKCDPLESGEKSFDLNSGQDFNFVLKADPTPQGSNVRCSDKGCRFPDNLKVTIQIDGFTCENTSGASTNTPFTGILTVISIYFITRFYRV